MRLLILSTNKQRDENILPVAKLLAEKYGAQCDWMVNNCLGQAQPSFIREMIVPKTTILGKHYVLDATTNVYKRRFRNLAVLKAFLAPAFLSKYDALLIGGDDYLGRYLMKKFRGKQRFLIQDGLFFNVTSGLIKREIINDGNGSLQAYFFYLKFLFKEKMLQLFTLLDISYLYLSFSGRSEYDLFFISGQNTKQLLLRDGVLPHRMQTSGIPRFRYLFEEKQNTGEKLPPFNKAPKAITFMTGAYKNHSQFEMDVCEKKFLRELCRRLEKMKGKLHLFIKVHPRDHASDFETFARNEFVTILTDVPIQRVLLESDIILANASTTSVEASFTDTPVIVTLVSFIQTYRFPSYYGNDRNHFCVAETWEELDEYIYKLTHDESYKQEVVNRQKKLAESLICAETVYSDQTIADTIFERVGKA